MMYPSSSITYAKKMNQSNLTTWTLLSLFLGQKCLVLAFSPLIAPIPRADPTHAPLPSSVDERPSGGNTCEDQVGQ